jgi:hypothetical protein
MSNIFKSNSRFAALTDEIPISKDKKKDRRDKKDNTNEKVVEKFNSFKNERQDEGFNSFKNERQDEGFNSFKNNGFRDRRYDERDSQKYKEQREAREKARLEFEQKEKERIQQEMLKIENFPDLICEKKIKQSEPVMSFIDKIKNNDEQITETINNFKDPDLENLKEGSVLLKYDPKTRKTIIKKHPNDEEKERLNLKKLEEEEKEMAKLVAKRLSDLHEKRTNYYIELYGYDTWEKMFKFPGWQEWEAKFNDIDSDEEDNDSIEYNENDNYYNDYEY